MMVVAAGRDEGRLRAETLHQLEAQDTAVEVERPLQVGDLQVDMADAHPGIDGRILFRHANSLCHHAKKAKFR